MEYQVPMTDWMWGPGWEEKIEGRIVLALFRSRLTVDAVPAKREVQVSADSRYKLYVNGRLVSIGPSKGDRMVWFYDTVDIAPYLTAGDNVLAVEVLRYPPTHKKGNHSVFRTDIPGLYWKDEAALTWQCRLEQGFEIVPEASYFSPLFILEDRTLDPALSGWRLPGYDDSAWDAAVPYHIYQVEANVSPGSARPRTIPAMRLDPGKFTGLYGAFESSSSRESWSAMLRGEGSVTIPAGGHETVEIDAGEQTTAFLSLRMRGGKGAVVTLLTSEGYVQHETIGNVPGGQPIKKDRRDCVNGYLQGFTDTCRPGGGESAFEPFWFRTFRFVRLEITAGSEPLELLGFDFLDTGYPLEAKTWVETSDSTLAPVWDISLRTLRRCMHETYEDCPFYEQLQYAMDSRSQILYTYMVSANDRLARKCMDDFRRSQRPDGMINCSYPCFGPNVIPGFAIYYIMMLYDHMMFFGDKALLRHHMGAADNVLEFFHRNIDDRGLVGKVGGRNIIDLRYWSFIDWTTQWDDTSGMPHAGLTGPITMESLLYILGLTHAADVLDYLGRPGVAEEYRVRAEAVKEAVRQYCRGENGMLQDGPGVDIYSQHCQVFGVLTGVLTPEEGRRHLQKTLDDPDGYAQCSVAMMYYLFRALELTGLYEYADKKWDLWREMVALNLTTCVEDNVRQRSDCHAWGSVALYELPAVALGVRPAAPGFGKIAVRPVPGVLTWARGEVITPKGTVKVSWKKENGELKLDVQAPAGIEIVK